MRRGGRRLARPPLSHSRQSRHLLIDLAQQPRRRRIQLLEHPVDLTHDRACLDELALIPQGIHAVDQGTARIGTFARLVAKLTCMRAAFNSHAGQRLLALLAIGYLAVVQQREEAAGTLVEALVMQPPGPSGEAVVLAEIIIQGVSTSR